MRHIPHLVIGIGEVLQLVEFALCLEHSQATGFGVVLVVGRDTITQFQEDALTEFVVVQAFQVDEAILLFDAFGMVDVTTGIIGVGQHFTVRVGQFM